MSDFQVTNYEGDIYYDPYSGISGIYRATIEVVYMGKNYWLSGFSGVPTYLTASLHSVESSVSLVFGV